MTDRARERRLPAPVVVLHVWRVPTVLAAGLSIAAAAIHLAAGPAHVAELGDLGLGFYWAALFQAAFAVALVADPRSIRLAWIGIVVNLALIGAWAWSRTVGLPFVPGGPEALGVADGTTVTLQLALVGMLVARLHGLDERLAKSRSTATIRSIATAGLVTVVGIVFLSTAIAVSDATAGHGHALSDGHDPASAPVGAEHGHGPEPAP